MPVRPRADVAFFADRRRSRFYKQHVCCRTNPGSDYRILARLIPSIRLSAICTENDRRWANEEGYDEVPAFLSRLSRAIDSCAVDEVQGMLDASNADDKKELLQRKYGPRRVHYGRGYEDENRVSLAADTSPILHAARMGNPKMCEVILKAMEKNKVRNVWCLPTGARSVNVGVMARRTLLEG